MPALRVTDGRCGAKTTDTAGAIKVSRSDIYGGSIINFVPFTKLEGDKIIGTHSG